MRKMIYPVAMCAMVAMCAALALCVHSCTATQLEKANTALGGTNPTTQPTTQQAVDNLGTTVVTNPVVTTGVNLLPVPFNYIATIALAIAGSYFAAGKINLASIIKQAAPGVATLVSQATDGVVSPTDISTLASVPTAVMTLINAHPAASGATTPAVAVAAVAPTSVTPVVPPVKVA